MMVSTKGRYALRVMIDLAQNKETGYISLKSVSERQEISVKYLEAIVAMLNRAGLLESRRGKEGGYRLFREPSEITVGEVLKLTEGSLAPVACMGKGGCKKCSREASCLTLPMWQRLDGLIDRYLESITIADLIDGSVKEKPIV